MNSKYRVKLVKLVSGERFPLLLDRVGMPVFESTIYSLGELRARNQAANTISAILRSIQVLYLFLDIHGINLSARLASGEILSLMEIEELVRLTRSPIENLDERYFGSQHGEIQKKTVSLEKIRARPARVKSQEVAPTFSGNRMRYIRNYLVWQISYFIATHFLEKKLVDDLQSSLQNLVLAINARLPPAGYRHSIQQREGLDPEAVSSLMIIVSPLSPDNPWKGVHSRYRNELIVQWFYYLGVRRGELLGVRVEDINFQKNEVTIHRRADDVNDPRLDQPQTKTKARVLPMSSALASLTRDYIINRRSAFKGARKHTFLFCADKTGLPMSLPTVNKLFKELRTACPFLSGPLSPHVLRHTWNDRFSELMDKNGITEEEEKKMRSNLMGWSETSETAAIYTKRHVREKAKIALLKMHESARFL